MQGTGTAFRRAIELMHNLTTADAPQTIYYVREQFQKAEQAGITCSINKPYYKGQRITMWSLIPMKTIPPTGLSGIVVRF